MVIYLRVQQGGCRKLLSLFDVCQIKLNLPNAVDSFRVFRTRWRIEYVRSESLNTVVHRVIADMITLKAQLVPMAMRPEKG